MSVTGPQNWLTQYTGVANTTSAGRCSAIACAMVARWSSGSGILPSVTARESIAASGTPLEASVRFSVAGAGSPGAGSAGSSATAKEAAAVRGPSPCTSTPTSTRQNPARSKVTPLAS